MHRPSLCIFFTKGETSQICARQALEREVKGKTNPTVYMNVYDLTLFPLPAFFPLSQRSMGWGNLSILNCKHDIFFNCSFQLEFKPEVWKTPANGKNLKW